MSAKKLLQRITGGEEAFKRDASITEESHIQTYGIKSDPLIQFAIVFSALIHDVQHPVSITFAWLVLATTSCLG